MHVELGENVDIELALERDDHFGQLARPYPLPGVEFRMIGGEVDVHVVAGKAHGEPFLPLALARVVSTLRHLPSRHHRHIDTTSDKDLAAAVQQHYADRRAVSRFLARHLPLRCGEARSRGGPQLTTRPLNNAMPRNMSTARVS